MSSRPEQTRPRVPGTDEGLGRLRSDLLRVARVHDHFNRLAARVHLWIAFTALLATTSVIALAWYFAGGRCCE
jgi:hypothetical protein